MERFSALLVAALVSGCLADRDAPGPDATENTHPPPSGAFQISSPAFGHMGDIPRRHTCDDANVSPPLSFANVPVNASTLALIMEDPDAPSGTINHWTFWDLPKTKTQLPEAVHIPQEGGTEGNNYGGPCPPDGEHRYFFYAYAVDGELSLPSGSSVDELRQALDGRVASEAEMYGLYCRPNAPPVPCVDPM